MTNKPDDQPGEHYALQPDMSLTAEGQPNLVGAALDPIEQDEGDQPTAWSMLRELLETVVLALIIFLLIRQGIQNYRIESHSMQPNFHEGEFILVNKLAYRLGEPARGDVIVFHNPNNPAEDYIKRVVALPGDTLEFRGDEVYLNGEFLEEPFVNAPTRAAGLTDAPIIVEPDSLFVMGDNRPNSRDSRSFGQLSQDLVVGKAWLQVWPLSGLGLVPHDDVE